MLSSLPRKVAYHGPDLGSHNAPFPLLKPCSMLGYGEMFSKEETNQTIGGVEAGQREASQ